ncbi:MAG: hypothetical protein ACKVQK_19045, partial [Burkholderiales bacterium]
ARVGYALARRGYLPEPMCKAILFHHDIARAAARQRDAVPADPRLVAFGLLTEQVVALRSDRGICPDWLANETEVLELLEVAPEKIVEIVEETGTVVA